MVTDVATAVASVVICAYVVGGEQSSAERVAALADRGLERGLQVERLGLNDHSLDGLMRVVQPQQAALLKRTQNRL